MCSVGGPTNWEWDEPVWYRYRCTRCDHVYRSTGKTSVCPKCKSEAVERV